MGLVHEFWLTSPGQLDAASQDALCDAGEALGKTGCAFCLPDDVVLRNIGEDADGAARFFTVHTEPGELRCMLDYWGLTLLTDTELAQLTAPLSQCGRIHPRDRYVISRFRRFCEEALRRGACVLHRGI